MSPTEDEPTTPRPEDPAPKGDTGEAPTEATRTEITTLANTTDRVKSALGATDKIDVDLHPRLKSHKEFFERHVGELKVAVERAVMKHRKQIVERQLVVERIADMAIDLYATAATLSRTQAFLAERGEEGCVTELLLCDLFCVDAGHRFRTNREALASREEEVDTTRRAVAEAMREGGGYRVDDPILAR